MQTTPLKILLADDDPAILRLLSAVLSSAGYEVRQAADGLQALAEIERDPPDFVLTDWEMPHLNGMELCRRVRALELQNYVYLLFLTGRSSSDSIIGGLDAGADDFLVKPVVPGELIARIRAGRRVLELERRLVDQARTDPLTGVLTRRAFHELLSHEFERSKRYDRPLSVVMLDVDFFKRVNDTYGHPAGDTVLRAVAKLLADSRRGSDVICRFGGEEFCAMLPETTEANACQWADRLRGAIAALEVRLPEKTLRVTASLGVAQRLDDTRSLETLVDAADQALLVAKQSGRDRVVNYASLAELPDDDLAAQHDAHDPFAGVVAADVMAAPVACLRQREIVGRAADFFCRFRISSAPVVDEAGQMVGVISERDVMGVMVAPEGWLKPVSDVMKANVVAYDEQTPLRVIFDFLSRVSIRRVIISRAGRPTGVIGRAHLLRWFGHWARAHGQRAAVDESAARAAQRRDDGERLDRAAAELTRRAAALERRIVEHSAESIPLVIHETSCMQGLLDDMLSYSSSALTAGHSGGTEASLVV